MTSNQKNEKYILVVDDESEIRSLIVRALDGRLIRHTGSTDEARQLSEDAHVILLDIQLGDVSGLTLLPEFVSQDPERPVIMMTAHGSVESAVTAMKSGAFDYITKPFSSLDELRLLVDRAIEQSRLKNENTRLKELLVEQDTFEEMVGNSPRMLKIYETIERIAPTGTTVLITGESGTGKELVARAIHRRSDRSDGAFIDLNCAAIPENLLESELFGYEKGAFTGAFKRKKGLFESADGGTLFLDEIGDMPLELQVKLLRVLDDNSFMRLGGNQTIQVDVRVVAATNKGLKSAVKRGTFREDLYYRLAVIHIDVPPLRKRQEDIISILKHLIPGVAIDSESMAILCDYGWPGNIRELKNFTERIKVLGTDIISAEDLPGRLGDAETVEVDSDLPLPDKLKAYEKEHIEHALQSCNGSRNKAAKQLGISRQALQYKLEKYGMDNA